MKPFEKEKTMETARDVTYQLLREFCLTTICGNVGSTEETFLKDFPSDFRCVLALQESSVIGDKGWPTALLRTRVGQLW
jgi:hypothetical protein